MSKEPQPLTQAEIAAELRRFAESNPVAAGARSIRYDLNGAPHRTALSNDNSDTDRDLPNQTVSEPEAGERYLWRCGSCGHKLTQSQVGKEFAAAALHKDGRRMTACPKCNGVAYHHEDERRIKEEITREEAKKARYRKHRIVCMVVAVLFFLALPACVGFLALVMVTLAAGPLALLDLRVKMAALLLAGSGTFLLSFLGAGLIVPENWAIGYILFGSCYGGVVIISLLISHFVRKIGDGVGSVIFRR